MKFRCQHLLAVACLTTWAWLGSSSFGQEIQWAADLATAKTEAARRNKPILLHFGASWCRPCQEVESFVFRNPAVIRKLGETVIPVRIDYDQNPQLAAEFGVKSLPTDVVITTSEKVLQKRNSPLEASAYVTMLDEIDRAQSSLAAGGQVVLNEKNQLAESWEQSRPKPGDSMELTPFDQQRPIAPGPGRVEAPLASAPNLGSTTAANSSLAPSVSTPVATVTKPLTAEARPSTAFNPKASGSQPPAAPQKVSNPFAMQSNGPGKTEPANPSAPPAHAVAAQGGNESRNSADGQGGVVLISGTQSDPPVALEGDCPVTLLKETKWIKGNEQLGAVHRGRLYLFASAEAQAEFLRDPESYSPLLAGFDPVSFHEQGKLVDGKKSHGVFMTRDGKQQVVLFENEVTRGKFRANPIVYLEAIRVATERADAAR